MTRDEQKQIIENALLTFGLSAQLSMLIEECAELIVAARHFERCRIGSINELIEELVDVDIMLNQICYAFRDNTELFNTYKIAKLTRLNDRINEYYQNKITH